MLRCCLIKLSWDVSQDRRSRKNICSKIMAVSDRVLELGGASRLQSPVGNVLRLGLQSGVGIRVGPVWRIKQAPEEVQGGKRLT